MNLRDGLLPRALRVLPPEAAHRAALLGLRLGLGPAPEPTGHLDRRLGVQMAGLTLAHPIGLAAGFDKDAEAPDALIAAGFSFVECGTVTPRPQAGNPRPRLFRLEEDAGVINRMGFNNQGLAAFAGRLAARASRPGLVGANVGANKDSVDRAGDYVTGLKAVWPHCAYLTVNVSSPNTPGLRDLQARAALDDLLGRVAEARLEAARAHGERPLLVKVAPDLDEAAIEAIVEAAVAHRIDGLVVSNTTVARPEGLKSAHARETGGLSGRPLFALSTQALRLAARAAAGRLALVGVGGVEDGLSALAKIKAGACAVQLYTGLVYGGPARIRALPRELGAALAAEGFRSVDEAIGADLR